jgi:hypothetical protein
VTAAASLARHPVSAGPVVAMLVIAAVVVIGVVVLLSFRLSRRVSNGGGGLPSPDPERSAGLGVPTPFSVNPGPERPAS